MHLTAMEKLGDKYKNQNVKLRANRKLTQEQILTTKILSLLEFLETNENT